MNDLVVAWKLHYFFTRAKRSMKMQSDIYFNCIFVSYLRHMQLVLLLSLLREIALRNSWSVCAVLQIAFWPFPVLCLSKNSLFLFFSHSCPIIIKAFLIKQLIFVPLKNKLFPALKQNKNKTKKQRSNGGGLVAAFWCGTYPREKTLLLWYWNAVEQQWEKKLHPPGVSPKHKNLKKEKIK